MGTLKGWGSSYLVSYYLEVLICTQQSLGLLEINKYQKLAPKNAIHTDDRVSYARGQVQGGMRANKNNLKTTRLCSGQAKQKFSLKIAETSSAEDNNFFNLKANASYGLAGLLFGLVLIGSYFLTLPKAYAADPVMDKVAIATKVIENVSTNMVDGEKPKENKTKFAVSEDFIQKPLVVETKITVDPPRVNAIRLYADGSNHFPYGYCTYYVAGKRTVTWSGNAGTWLSGAQAAGMETGKTPQPGAIMVTSEGGKVGHVAYVEKVDGNKITVSEMNYKGYGIVSTRTIASNLRVIKGFIY